MIFWFYAAIIIYCIMILVHLSYCPMSARS